jgi:hypothetical protein
LRKHLPDVDAPLSEHVSAREAALHFGREYETYFRFAFVRNPWGRLWSWYGMLKNAPGVRELSFDDFLNSWIRADGGLELATQVDFLSDENGTVLVDEIGRFEDFENEIRRIFSMSGITPELSLPRLNSGSEGAYETGYTQKGRELVARAYQRDIEAFGYDF